MPQTKPSLALTSRPAAFSASAAVCPSVTVTHLTTFADGGVSPSGAVA